MKGAAQEIFSHCIPVRIIAPRANQLFISQSHLFVKVSSLQYLANHRNFNIINFL